MRYLWEGTENEASSRAGFQLRERIVVEKKKYIKADGGII